MVDDRPQSEFNMAVNYLGLLHMLFIQAEESAISLDADTWFHNLMAIERVLSTEMKKGEIEKFEVMEDNINELLTKRNKVRNGRPQGINAELYKALRLFDLELRRIAKESGLLTKVMDDMRKAMR